MEHKIPYEELEKGTPFRFPTEYSNIEDKGFRLSKFEYKSLYAFMVNHLDAKVTVQLRGEGLKGEMKHAVEQGDAFPLEQGGSDYIWGRVPHDYVDLQIVPQEEVTDGHLHLQMDAVHGGDD